MHSNPDLYFNCASANKYLENYERALHGFEAATLKDPGLNADDEAQKITSLLDKIESSLKGLSRSKRLASLVSTLGEVICKYYLICDSDQTCFVLSVYGLHSDAVRISTSNFFQAFSSFGAMTRTIISNLSVSISWSKFLLMKRYQLPIISCGPAFMHSTKLENTLVKPA
ncbi:hypothetical protein BHE74_00037931 [Ensete ventricosum]|nr:hypothetical protein GW17_00011625 [Ensete ventricosum]RWW55429.1 hypothetical protein BHE74_00037931 [Ensete ventricosum]RZR91849.1 hypothetical protein BHM03_00020039 [Ensete ventricosum]